ncbi:hypothetical protein BJY04DRAFT_148363 [Aspergillus karnatakaensis]|uniref:uncharacterized protein n=1 Tax=Aspergillus karnatakaensis TaxID=1810916 RepID=UPI003CCD25C4
MFNPNLPFHQTPTQIPRSRTQSRTPIVIDSESEDDDNGVTHRTQTGYDRRYNPSASTSASPASSHHHHQTYPPPPEQEKKIRSRLREERHAALCVLMDRELLTIQALAAQETLPQTRRRFLSTLLSPSDPATAALVRADQFTVPVALPSSISSPSTSTLPEPMVVSRRVVDVCETDDAGWFRPKEGMGSGARSPAVGSRAGTPERSKAQQKGRSASGRHSVTPRERRRRWSGAERQDFGAGFGERL